MTAAQVNAAGHAISLPLPTFLVINFQREVTIGAIESTLDLWN
jgi:hypothetical protein